MENEEVPIEVSFNIVRKAAMITVESTTGEKQQRSEVVKGKNIQDAFPINMLENNHGWKLTVRLTQDLQGRRSFDLIINQVNFLDHDFISQDQNASQTLKGAIKINEGFFLDEDQEFEWNSNTARNRIKEFLFED